MSRSIALLLSLACLAGAVGRCAAQSLATVDATAIRSFDARIAVARAGGGVALYDSKGGAPLALWPTEKKALSLRALGGSLCWVEEGSREVSIARVGSPDLVRIDVPKGLVQGPIRRLSAWQDYIVVHGDRGFAFLDPVHRLVRAPMHVLPREIWKVARLGAADSTWGEDGGMFVSVRRLPGTRPIKERGEIADIGMITAWSMDPAGHFRLLGGYAASLARFQPDDRGGPDAIGPLGNLRLGPEGIVGLGLNEVFAVPFYQEDWQPNRLRTVFRPDYAQSADYASESAWWTDGKRLFRADLTDGSSDAFVPREDAGPIRDVLADADGAWIATGQGVRHVDFEGDATFAKVSMAAYEEPKTREQRALLARVDSVLRGSGRERSVADLLKSSGGKGRPVAEGEIGDLVEGGGGTSIYLGGGKVLVEEAGELCVRPVSPTADTRFTRVLKWTELTEADLRPVVVVPPVRRPAETVLRPLPLSAVPTTATSLFEEGEIAPIGINRPKSSLGSSLFVRCVVGAPFDAPRTAAERRLLDVARGWLGTPYRWGGNTKAGVDCSGFVTAVYREMGIQLPRYSQNIGRARIGKVVRDQLHFGDVLVFQSPKHVALYVGGGRTIEAVGGGVGYSNVARRTQAIVRRFL